MDERLRCQCACWDEPCGQQMTQEDLRCDSCRGDSCGLLTLSGPPKHIRVFSQVVLPAPLMVHG